MMNRKVPGLPKVIMFCSRPAHLTTENAAWRKVVGGEGTICDGLQSPGGIASHGPTPIRDRKWAKFAWLLACGRVGFGIHVINTSVHLKRLLK